MFIETSCPDYVCKLWEFFAELFSRYSCKDWRTTLGIFVGNNSLIVVVLCSMEETMKGFLLQVDPHLILINARSLIFLLIKDGKHNYITKKFYMNTPVMINEFAKCLILIIVSYISFVFTISLMSPLKSCTDGWK